MECFFNFINVQIHTGWYNISLLFDYNNFFDINDNLDVH